MKKNEAIFKVSIDYPYKIRNNGIRLSQFAKYTNLESKLPSYRRVQEIASKVILQELPQDFSEIFDIKISTRIIAEREGSFIVYFGVAMTAYTLIGGYSSFFSGLELIEEHTKLLLQKAFEDEYSENMEIEVYRKLPDRKHRLIGRKEKDLFFGRNHDFEYSEPKRRGSSLRGKGFFIYLLVMNVVLMSVIGIIAYKAIMTVYFGNP